MRTILSLQVLLLVSSTQIIAQFDSISFLKHQVRSLSTAVSIFPFWKNAYAFWVEQQLDDEPDSVPKSVEDFVRVVLRNKGIEDESEIEISYQPCGDNPVNAEYSYNSLCICSSPSYMVSDNKKVEFEVDPSGNILFGTSEMSQEEALWELIEYYETIVANLHDAVNLKKRIEHEMNITQQKFQLRFLKKILHHVNNLLEEYIAVIQHEAGHHHHKVTRSLMRANIISPVLFSIICAASADLIKNNPSESQTKLLSVVGMFLPILSAMCTYCTTSIFLAWFDRHQEWKADEFVDSNPFVLKGLKRAIKRIQQYEHMDCTCCSKKSWATRLKNLFKNYLLADEPSVSSRLKRVEQRLVSVGC